MSTFALVDRSDTVIAVIVADQDFIDTLAYKPPGHEWVKTSINTYRGQYTDPVTGQTNTQLAVRGNYAGRGMRYDRTVDAFVAPKPYPSWTLDMTTYDWVAPIPKPDGDYVWNERTLKWVIR